MFRTKHLKLTKEQRERGIVYSSMLIVTNNPEIEPVLHEVHKDDPRRDETIKNLEDVSFFKGMASDFGFDVINEVRR